MQGQAFTQEDARVTGMVVSALVVGLPAYVLVKVLTPNFFARADTRTPVYTAAASLMVTVALNFALVPLLGVVGLALGRGGGGVGQYRPARRYPGPARGFFRLPVRVVGRLVRIGVAATAMGAALIALMPYIAPWLDGTLPQKLLAIAAIGLVSLATYGAGAVMLGILDKATVQRLMRRQT